MAKKEKVYVRSGIGIGSVLAIILSWTTWHSILWAILHAFFGWAYVIYWLIRYGGN